MVKETRWESVPLALCVLVAAGLMVTPARAAPPMVLAQVYLDSLDHEPEGSDAPTVEEPQLDLPDLDEIPGTAPRLRPDMKEGAEGGAPPQSAEDTKQNKLDPQLGELRQGEPVDRKAMLAELYERLGAARDMDTAAPIMQAIEKVWAVSGSATVDLLMARAARFANEDEIDLSLSILDAVVDIAPQEAEAWYLRAKVHVLDGKPKRSLADLRRALSLDPKHYLAINDLGLVLEQLGAKKEALDAYRRALAVNPFLEDARQGVEALAREVEGQDI